MFDRYAVIKLLIEDDVDYIENCGDDGRIQLHSYLQDGFKGYANFTNDELIKECEERDISYLVAENDD
jgi:hypothetical protein